MNATGPYRFYGEAVVQACIATRTDYVDLCGEPEFIDRCILKHADAARDNLVFAAVRARTVRRALEHGHVEPRQQPIAIVGE